MTQQNFPFLFIGARPQDWSTDHHPYRVVFVSQPDVQNFPDIARCLENFRANHPTITISPWQWNGRHVRFSLDADSSLETDEFFISVQTWMRQLHRQQALLAVIHESAIGETPFSLQPMGTEWAILEPFEISCQTQQMQAQQDVALRRQKAIANQEQFIATQTHALRLSIATCEITELPPSPLPPPPLSAAFDAVAHPTRYLFAAGRWVGLIDRGILYIDSKGKVKKRAAKLDYKDTAIISPDGMRVILSSFRSVLIQFPDAKLSDIVAYHPLGFVGDQHLACLDIVHKVLQIWSLAGAVLTEIHCPAYTAWVVAHRWIAVHVDADLLFYQYIDAQLSLLATLPNIYPSHVWSDQGRIFAKTYDQSFVEVLGISAK